MKSISVIIPTNGKRNVLLRKCIRSLLKQSLIPNEIVIVDNSIDKKVLLLSKEFNLITSIPIRYISERRIGVAFARNRGIRKSTSTILAFIDDDCTASAHWIKNLLSVFERLGTSILVKGTVINGLPNNIIACAQYFNDELIFRSDFRIIGGVLTSSWLDTKNCAFSKKLILKHRLYFKNHLILEDLDFSLRAKMLSIPIITSAHALVSHFGCSTMYTFICRALTIGRGFVRLNNIHKITPTANNAYLYNSPRVLLNSKTYENNLFNRITDNKNALFKFLCHFVIQFSAIAGQFGRLFELGIYPFYPFKRTEFFSKK
jgi:GT2 family glycosyltransferase